LEHGLWIVLGALLLTALVWVGYERSHFRGPPSGVLAHAGATRSGHLAASEPR
jgi:hypothetical protein